MGIASKVRVHSSHAKAWTTGMNAHDRPDIVVFEIEPMPPGSPIDRKTALSHVLEYASASLIALPEVADPTHLSIRTPYGSYRIEHTVFGVVELRLQG